MESTLEYALSYAARGWRVFQVHSMRDGQCTCGNADCPDPAKHPVYATAPSGHLGAVTDEATIRDWWTRYPWANIGIATGPESGLLVIDVDPKNDGNQTYIDLVIEHGDIPDAPTVKTGSLGAHIYLAYPASGKAKSGANTLGPGVDSRGYGGYVVAPPSLHKSGRQYTWDMNFGPETPLAPAPEWVLEALKAPDTTKPIGGDTPDDIIPDGQRNATLTAIAGGLRRNNFTPDEIFNSLMAANQRRCRPPLSESEIRKIAGSMGNYAPNPSPIKNVKQDLPRVVTSTAQMVRLDDLLDEPPIEQPFLVDELLILGGTSLWVAKPGIGKSTTIRSMARVVAGAGSKFLSRSTENGVVLYYAMEENRDQVRRHFDAMGSRNLPFEMHLQIGAISDDALRQAWIKIQELNPILVIIDPLMAMADIGEPNNYSLVRHYMEQIQEIARQTGCHIACIHHSNKAIGREGIDSANGSIAFPGTVDTMITMRKTRENLVLIKSEKVRYGRDLPETVLIMNERREVVDGGTYEEQALSLITEQIIGAIGLEELTEPEIAERLTSVSRGEISKALRSLVIAGKLVRTGAGRRNSPYRYTPPTDLSDFPEFNMPALWPAGSLLPEEGIEL